MAKENKVDRQEAPELERPGAAEVDRHGEAEVEGQWASVCLFIKEFIVPFKGPGKPRWIAC